MHVSKKTIAMYMAICWRTRDEMLTIQRSASPDKERLIEKLRADSVAAYRRAGITPQIEARILELAEERKYLNVVR
jgi:hypothetical protein